MRRLYRSGPLLACLLALAGCAGHSFALRAPFEMTANGFWYRHDCKGPCDLHGEQAERLRLRALDETLRRHRHCPEGYMIDSRRPLAVTAAAAPDIVVYEGRCRGR